MSPAGYMTVVMDGLAFSCLLFTIASGLSLCFGAAGVLNLAHGMTWLGGAYLGSALIASSWTGFGAAIGIAALTGAAGGVLIAIVINAVSGQLMQALASIGLALVAGFALTKVFGVEPRVVNPPENLAVSTEVFGRPYPLYRLLIIGFGVGCAILLWLLLNRTHAGVLVRACASDRRALSTLGVDPRRIGAAVVAGASALAAVAGVVGSPFLGPAPSRDHHVLVLSLIIVVAGGVDSVVGAAIAALAVGQAHTTVALAWPNAAPYLPYLVLIAALVVQAIVRRYWVRSA